MSSLQFNKAPVEANNHASNEHDKTTNKMMASTMKGKGLRTPRPHWFDYDSSLAQAMAVTPGTQDSDKQMTRTRVVPWERIAAGLALSTKMTMSICWMKTKKSKVPFRRHAWASAQKSEKKNQPRSQWKSSKRSPKQIRTSCRICASKYAVNSWHPFLC